MSETDALPTVDVDGIEARAHPAAHAGDLDTLGALIRETDDAQRLLLGLARSEDLPFRETSRELGSSKARLAALPESEARAKHAELTFAVDFHRDRAALCH